MIVTLQPAPVTDQITGDGTELTRLPYPFHVAEDGLIQRQDFWRGDPLRVLGFVADPSQQQIDLTWEEFVTGDYTVVGMYMITGDADGGIATHLTAIETVTRFPAERN